MASKFAVASRANGRRNLKDEEFEEEDLWGAMENTEISGPKVRKFKENSLSFSSSSSSSSPWRSPTAPATIPRPSNPSKEANKLTTVKQSSAPMDIPGRRKVYGMMSSKKKSCPWVDYDGHGMNDGDGEVVVDDDDNDEDEIVPPHEYIARRLASSQISSSSVCEGIGRTLKGRDLSRVRNTILRKTGFLEG